LLLRYYIVIIILTQIVLYNGCKMVVVTVIITELQF